MVDQDDYWCEKMRIFPLVLNTFRNMSRIEQNATVCDAVQLEDSTHRQYFASIGTTTAQSPVLGAIHTNATNHFVHTILLESTVTVGDTSRKTMELSRAQH